MTQHATGRGLRDSFFSLRPMYVMSARVTGGATPVIANTVFKTPDTMIAFVIC